METSASYGSTISKDFQAPNVEHPPGITTSARSIQTPISLQPPTTPNTSAAVNNSTHHQQQTGNDSNTQRGQQKKKGSRFLLEMPQLNMPRPRPITSTTLANARPQVTTTRPNTQQQQKTASSQATAKTSQRRVVQLEMPSIHTPSRPKPPATSTVHHATKVSGPSEIHNTPLTVSAPSLQISMPAQVEHSGPMTHQVMNKNDTQSQPGSANSALHAPQSQQQHVGPLSPEMVANGVVASQQDDVSDSSTTATNTSQEMQVIEKNNASTPQDTPSVTSVSKEGEILNSDEITETSGAEESSVFSATDVQTQQPLQQTTPTHQPATASESAVGMTNTSTTSTMPCMTAANTVEMADPPITTYTDPTFNQVPQQMDTTNSASYPSSQDPMAAASGGYTMYGAEMYQQPNQQMQMVILHWNVLGSHNNNISLP